MTHKLKKKTKQQNYRQFHHFYVPALTSLPCAQVLLLHPDAPLPCDLCHRHTPPPPLCAVAAVCASGKHSTFVHNGRLELDGTLVQISIRRRPEVSAQEPASSCCLRQHRAALILWRDKTNQKETNKITADKP